MSELPYVDEKEVLVMDDTTDPWDSPPVRMMALMLHVLLREQEHGDVIITEEDREIFEKTFPNRPTVALRSCPGHLHATLYDTGYIEMVMRDRAENTTEH